MSHFSVYAIVKPDEDIEKQVNELLAPFNENTSVEPYEKPCWCKGREAINRADKQLDADMGSWEDARIKFHLRPTTEQTEYRWQEDVYKPRMAHQGSILASYPDKNNPNPDCSVCHGTGIETTTYNPRSKWDWYQIGGRWQGTLNNNQSLVKYLIKPPYAYVTHEGWFERGQMGWWGISTNEVSEQEWLRQFECIKKAYADHLAIVVDCHI